MKVRSLALATIIAVTASGYAFAQSTTSPSDKGSKSSDTSSSGTMSNDKMAKDKMMKSETTGKNAGGNSAAPTSNGDVSPASSNSGEAQQK
jgi:pentapeptide MXKDX repeat protein